MVWMRAPPSASWVPMVCRNRCAVIVALPAESTRPAAVQASARAMSNSSDLDQLAAHEEDVLNLPPCAGVVASAAALLSGQVDQGL